MSRNIVVLGAGVSGLTTAYLLSQDPSKKITVVAKHMPGDYDIEYASPWAGANYLPVGKKGTPHQSWERSTWPVLKKIAENHPEAGIHFLDAIVENRVKDRQSTTGIWFAELVQQNPWYKDVVPDFQNIPRDRLAPGIDGAQKFTSAADAHHSGQKADVVVNCTGLSSKKLGGVLDDAMYPARGQIVVVRNDPGPMYTVSGTDDGEDEVLYIMTRAAGGGTILGGSYQRNNWDPLPDHNLANRIMQRAVTACPQLVKDGKGIEGLDIVRHGVGLRPVREGGPRIEKEQINGVRVVHNYGHGGFGYQASFGCAEAAATLVKEVLQEIPKAKL
ncbi:hypothetical protein N7468_001329 [Penicillium chermesinum]|uniref:D-amino-acid oxidase n=1 Tax=Penicillium chermesinum TaxID=63820 RepID=A0A9W9PGE8_9EURO|nr:uncharacterized protein N7468_001329 [Penicillium chermesinum]KAJ5246346.1 hypothetical protein N7468_001329 [Penicillium chermesinum]